jgi:hypothetical protein
MLDGQTDADLLHVSLERPPAHIKVYPAHPSRPGDLGRHLLISSADFVVGSRAILHRLEQIQLLRQAVCSCSRVAPRFIAMLIFYNVAALSFRGAIQAHHGRSRLLRSNVDRNP